MEINAHNLGILRTAVTTRFNKAFSAVKADEYKKFAMTIPMGTGQLDMPFFEQLCKMREWIDNRVIQNMATRFLTVRPRNFELTYGIPKNAINDDQYGVYMDMVEEMAVNAANLPHDLCEELLNNAANAKWLDNGNFFGTTRKYGKSTISNYSTNALTKANFKTAYDLMKAYKGHGDVSMRVVPDLVVYGPNLKWTAKALFENPMEEINGAALPNDTYNIVKTLEMPGITGNKWFLFATGRGVIRPVGYFEREKPNRITRLDKADDENVFMRGEFLYGCDGRAEAAFLFPHLAYFGNPA